MRVRLFLLGGALLGLVPACGPTADRAAPTASAPAAISSPIPAPGYRLFVHDGYGRSPQVLRIIDAGSGKVERELPLGVPARDWSRLYTVESSGADRTTVRAIDPASGNVAAEAHLDGKLWSPYGLGLVPAGLSPNGRWLALTNWTVSANQVGKSRYQVLDASLAQPPRGIELDGRQDFAALSNDGAHLYVNEYLSQPPGVPRSHLRRYDLAPGRLDSAVVLDRSPKKQGMIGNWQSYALSPDGRYLYRLFIEGDKGPFLYGLDLDRGEGFSVDLPWSDAGDWEQRLLWLLAVSQDGGRLYAINAELGLVAQVDTAQRRVLRAAKLTLPPKATAFHLFRVAEAKRFITGGAALSPDGRLLLAPAIKGMIAIDTEGFSLRGSYLRDWAFDSIAMSPDGAWLYAVSAERQRLLQIDPRSGTIAAEVEGAPRPIGVLRVEAKF